MSRLGATRLWGASLETVGLWGSGAPLRRLLAARAVVPVTGLLWAPTFLPIKLGKFYPLCSFVGRWTILKKKKTQHSNLLSITLLHVTDFPFLLLMIWSVGSERAWCLWSAAGEVSVKAQHWRGPSSALPHDHPFLASLGQGASGFQLRGRKRSDFPELPLSVWVPLLAWSLGSPSERVLPARHPCSEPVPQCPQDTAGIWGPCRNADLGSARLGGAQVSAWLTGSRVTPNWLVQGPPLV